MFRAFILTFQHGIVINCEWKHASTLCMDGMNFVAVCTSACVGPSSLLSVWNVTQYLSYSSQAEGMYCLNVHTVVQSCTHRMTSIVITELTANCASCHAPGIYIPLYHTRAVQGHPVYVCGRLAHAQHRQGSRRSVCSAVTCANPGSQRTRIVPSGTVLVARTCASSV